MKRLSLKDILEIPQLAFYISFENFANFANKKSDASDLINLAAIETQEHMMRLINAKVITEQDMITARTDNISTRTSSKAISDIFRLNSQKVNPSLLMLQKAFMSRHFLSQLDRAQKGDKTVNSELSFANGDIVTINNGKIAITSLEENPKTIEQVRSDLAEGILIANQYFANEKNKNVGISGTYQESGISERKIRMNYSIKDLVEDAKSPMVLSSFSKEKLSELLDKKMISRGVLVRLLSTGALDKNTAIELFLEDKLSRDEVVGKIFKKSNIQGVALDDDTSFKSKLLLYSTGKISIDVLERAVEKYHEENLDLSDELSSISKFYKGNIKKAAELLTHNVLDYSNSKKFLDILQSSKQISEEDKTYLEQVMSDFKINEIVNNTTNGELVSTSDSKKDDISTSVFTPHLTIDPDKRLSYLRSIGAVKKLKVRGETLVKDSDENLGKKNSLDGYEVFIIPDKKIAVLEKLYEVSRDEKGNLSYKTNKDGKLIPAINNATYIMPIEMAKELTEKRNKSDLMKSPYVRRANHTLDWVSNLEAKMKTINPSIQFEPKNTKFWGDFIRKNYLDNLERRNRD